MDAIDRIPLGDDLSALGNIGEGTQDQQALNGTEPLDKVGFSGGRFTFTNDWNKTRVTDPTTGETHLRHHVTADCYYLGNKLIQTKSSFVEED